MLAIAGGKGGCGKTTTTLAVARRLAARDVAVRAVDVDDGMPDLHRLAGVDREPTLAAVVREARPPPGAGPRSDRRRVGRVRTSGIQRDEFGVEVVPAKRVTADVDLDEALAVLARDRPLSLLDCPAGAGPDATAPVRTADGVLLVSTARPESLEDAAKTGRVARRLGVPVLGAVVTRTDDLSARVRSALPTDRVVPVPEADDPLADATALERYDDVAAWLLRRIGRWGSTGRDRGRPRSRRGDRCRRDDSAPAARECRRNRPFATDVATDDGAPRAASERVESRADGTTRPRDRRSRRSRGAAGTRSSSRGGGAPSGQR